MPHRYLVGPVTPARAAKWQAHRDQGRCLAFHASAGADVVLAPTDTWETLLSRLPAGWRPDFIVLDLGYTTVPACFWDVPVPLVALSPDAQLQWYFFRRFLPVCQLVLTDTAAVQAMHRLGITQAAQANLFGLQDVFAHPVPPSAERRTIDVLFVGNLHPAVQRQRLRWLGRLARLADRWNVYITQGVHGEDYRRLLLRSRIVFNHSVRGEWNLRVGEACSCGALLFTESDNLEMPGVWKHREDCVFCDEDNLEALLEHYLSHEDQRAAVAESGRRKAETFTFAATWEEAVARIEQDWPLIQQRYAQRPRLDTRAKLLARTWQAMGAADGGDPSLPADLDAALGEQPDAALHNARGMVESLQRRDASGRYTPESLRSIAAHFHRAASLPLSASGRWPGGGVLAGPGGGVAALNFIEALALSGYQQLAVEGAQRLLGRLLSAPAPVEEWDLPHFPASYDFFRVEWERVAWQHAGSPSQERQAKLSLLRWRLHSLLADWTHDLVHRHEAALARPDLPPTRAALGCALGEAKRPQEAVPHLHYAVEQNPFDRSAARATAARRLTILTQGENGRGGSLQARTPPPSPRRSFRRARRQLAHSATCRCSRSVGSGFPVDRSGHHCRRRRSGARCTHYRRQGKSVVVHHCQKRGGEHRCLPGQRRGSL